MVLETYHTSISSVRVCQNCKGDFVIEPDDFAFYDKMKVPAPTFCSECRLRRRLSFRNERILYKRSCDLCGKEVISIYNSESKNVMYCHDCWWSDKWDRLAYGQEYDFSKLFFEQYQKLSKRVPRENLMNANSINCEYTHLAADNKDCYLLFESSNNERCNHSYWMQLSKDCLDCAFVNNSELCYEVSLAWNCYKVFFSKECRDCADCYFLQDCVGLANCYGCVNLRNKSYCVFNKQYTKEEYEKILQDKKEQIKNGKVSVLLKEFKDFALKNINKFSYIQKSINSTGDNLLNVKNCINCFDGYDAENCKYGYHVWRDAKDVMDVSTVGRGAELIYESINTGIKAYNMKFGIQNWNGNDSITYSESCSGSSNLFGCISLHAKQYCILNKQYTKEEYEILVSKIIEKMKQDGEYGEFFPSKISLFAYNETVAQDHFPLSKEDALKKGLLWKDKEDKNVNIVGDIIECLHKGECNDHCTIGFKIIQAEKDFYERMSLPVPVLCPNCRHYERLRQRNPLKLWNRKCMKPGCTNKFETSYAPDKPEIIYCEDCYQQEVI